MPYPEAAWERALRVQEVMLKAISGELHWYQAAEILGWSPRPLHGRRPAGCHGPGAAQGGRIAKAVRSFVKRKRTNHLSTTARRLVSGVWEH